MQRKLIAILVANLFAGLPAVALAQGDFTVTGEVGVGGIVVDETTKDGSKLNEYRDMSNGALTLIDLKGRGQRYYLDFFGENLGRDDMFLSLKGGSYGSFKYSLFSDSLKHNFGFGMRTPYSGAGTANQTVGTTYQPVIPPVPPSTTPGGNFFFISNGASPASWNTYDLAYKRRNDGASVEVSFNSPFYVRADVGQITFKGNKLQAYAQGTSPGNGFVDFATPVDYTTKNLSFEAGYATRQMQLSLNFLSSNFENANKLLTWTNAYFASGTDASPLAPDNDYTRWSANAIFKRLPLGSTLALRYTTSQADNTVDVLQTALNTGTGTPLAPTNPSVGATSGTFKGDVKYDTLSVALNSAPTKIIDTKLFYNSFKKKNRSTQVNFIPAPFPGTPTVLPSGLNCADQLNGAARPDCDPELFSYEKKNYGLDVGVRLPARNRLVFGYDYSDIDRERFDVGKTEEKKYALEWKNSTLDNVSVRAKVQRLDRSSEFKITEAFVRGLAAQTQVPGTFTFTNATQGFIEAFVRRYDVADMKQDLAKLSVDFSPADNVDLGAETYFKKSKFSNESSAILLGRTNDDRQGIHLSATFGDPDVFRLTAFVDYETVKYTSYHRVGNPLDPFLAPTTTAYNWTIVVRDNNDAFGLGFAWPFMERLTFDGSLVWSRTKGKGDLSSQVGGATLLDIPNYGNNERFALNLRGKYRLDNRWSFIGGLAYEDVQFNDIQYNGFTYIVPVTPINNSTSYLSGYYADPTYKATIVYLTAKYSF